MAETKFDLDLTCPEDCSTEFLFKTLDADQDCPGTIEESQLTDLWISPKKTGATGKVLPFSGWTANTYTITGELANIDNSNTDNTKCKNLAIVGGVAVPDKTIITVHKRLRKTIRRRYTLQAQVFNLSHAQREFVRSLQCNPTNFTFWFGNQAYVWGKDTGIIPVFSDADLPLGAGEGDFENATILLEWEAKIDPERRENPFV